MFPSSGKLPSVMKHSFANVPQANVPRSVFNRSHGYKTTIGDAFTNDTSYLYPIFVDEALPGDTFSLSATTFARLSTPIVPVMDNLSVDVHFFAVPYRLVWDNFQKFMGEQRNPGDSTSYLIPQFTSPGGGYTIGSIQDYMGLPTGVGNLAHSILPMRCYNLIWNEWYRDQNLQNSLTVSTDDGNPVTENGGSAYALQPRGKRHDYFTSCLPWPQKGTAVSIPLGTTAPVLTNTVNPVLSSDAGVNQSLIYSAATGNIGVAPGSLGVTDRAVKWGNQTGMLADLSAATAATINSLRQAFQIQRLYERDARGGSRYTEIIRSHFGVVSPDARLQRPEYLGGGTAPVNFTPVPQTSATDGTSPQGNLSSFGTFSHSGVGFSKSFTEHCIILGLLSVRGDLNYQQGLNRMWSRRTRWDFYWPSLAHLGEQAVLNKEIYAQGNANDDLVFGYQERFAEYRFKPSQITGSMRSTAADSLDIWHLGQEFTGLPVLNSTFIQERPPLSRVLAVPTEPAFLLDCYFKLNCARPMPTYSVPGLIDHF